MEDGDWQQQAKSPPRQPATGYRHIDINEEGEIIGLSLHAQDRQTRQGPANWRGLVL